MRQEEKRYSIGEISLATGIKAATLQGRRKRLGIPSGGGYTLEQAKQMIRRPPARRISKRNADQLRAQLLNDGAI